MDVYCECLSIDIPGFNFQFSVFKVECTEDSLLKENEDFMDVNKGSSVTTPIWCRRPAPIRIRIRPEPILNSASRFTKIN